MLFNFGKKPKVHLYSICWNEEYMLKYFFRYYDKLVDRYIFFDDGSTDQTLKILNKHPNVEVRPFPHLDHVDSYVLAAQNLHNNCWKESRGLVDWVIITAVDEFLYTPDLKWYLNQCQTEGVTAIPALGYQMISSKLPASWRSLTNSVKSGCPWGEQMNKLSVFNPDKLVETNQLLGRHGAQPQGEIIYPKKDELLLLHYKYLSMEHTLKRHMELNGKLGSVDKENEWGVQYGWTREKLQSEWDFFKQNSVENIFSPRYDPHLAHSPLSERWWRQNMTDGTSSQGL